MTNATILAIIAELHGRLARAAVQTSGACEAMQGGHHDLAIGTILDLEKTLPECDALFRAALVLPRGRDKV